MKYSSLVQAINNFYKTAIEAAKKINEKQQVSFFDALNQKLYPSKNKKTPTIDLVVPEEIIIASYKMGEPVPVALTESTFGIHPITGEKKPIFLFRFGVFSPRDKYLTEEEFPQNPQTRLIYAKNRLASLPEYQANKKNLEIFNLKRNQVFLKIDNAKYREHVAVFFK